MPALLAVSDVVLQAGIGGVVTIVTTICAAVLAWMQWKTKLAVVDAGEKATEAAEKARLVVDVNARQAAAAAIDVKKTLEKTTADSNQKLESIAADVGDQKTTLAEKTGTIDEKLATIALVGHATHVLVNGNMRAQLKKTAAALRRVAELTKHAGDLKAAKLAEKLLLDHEQKQTVVDQSKEAQA